MWLLWCMFIVALAMIEYAILLKIRYSQLKKLDVQMQSMDKTSGKTKQEEKCKKIDKYAMVFFIFINIMTIGTYLCVYY